MTIISGSLNLMVQLLNAKYCFNVAYVLTLNTHFARVRVHALNK